MSPAFIGHPESALLGISNLVWIAAAVDVAAWISLDQTAAGRALYAIGETLSRRDCGIGLRAASDRLRPPGAVAGLGGYLWVSRYGIASSDIALGYELTVIAACVIGGVRSLAASVRSREQCSARCSSA